MENQKPSEEDEEEGTAILFILFITVHHSVSSMVVEITA
jgi:hypothetical protein